MKKHRLWNLLFSLFSTELSANRIFGLDILRAFAIIVVMIDHGKFIFPKKIVEFHNYIQVDGVSIFFVLSGFLIGGILINQLENKPTCYRVLIDFWIRRWFRTLPTYFLILTILIVCYQIKNPSFTIHTMMNYYIFCQNLYQALPPEYFAESWSLSVEEWFYLTIPFIIFSLIIILKWKPRKAVLVTALIVLCGVTFLRYTIHTSLDLERAKTFHHIVIYRLDSIMYGVIAAYLKYYYSKYWNLIPLPLFIIGLFILFSRNIFLNEMFPDLLGLYKTVFEFSLTSLATLLLLPFLSHLKQTKHKAGILITSISILSYSMYLTHMSLIKGMILYSIPWTRFTKNYHIIIPILYSLYWGTTFLFSAIIYKLYEYPMTKIRDKFRS
ncbi:acyltransferase [Chryseobacterium sp.]|uniref:acyltransferase family protein n=1 Tax=Chryseobacterium sp. TaxID=1871047 RepID=UPI0025B93ACC|nr:acyltransferase [Chryseobacterium sp.]MBV8325176.1 acyltransferase [Chryseobacterium sp.]